MHVVATAGHVDHGKSTLVRALTGTDPDRLTEEHRRGLSIELGYCWTGLPGVGEVAFVDVPGHERFISTMLSGIGPVPAVLLVVAADDPWMPQAAEHLAALDALGVEYGAVAVTRADLADPAAMSARARAEVDRTTLRGSAVIPVSARTGAGVDDVRAALAALVSGLPTPSPDADVRLWVDRRFHVAGTGTVVTGTLPAGRIRVGDRLQGGDGAVRVRGIQTLERPVPEVSGVSRVALGLGGNAPPDLERGSALVTPGRWTLARTVDVRVGPPAQDLPHNPQLHIGSSALTCRARPLGGDLVRLALGRGVPLRIGDRALLRDPGSRRVWGLTVLDPDPPELRRRGAARQRADALAGHPGLPDLAAELRRRGVASRAALERLGVDTGGADGLAPAAGDWLLDPAHAATLHERLGQIVRAHDEEDPLDPGVPVAAAARALDLPTTRLVEVLAGPPLRIAAGRVLSGEPSGPPTAVRAAVGRLSEQLAGAPFSAPDAGRLAELGLDTRTVAAAAKAGLVLRLADSVLLLPGADGRAAELLSVLPQPFTASQARTALGTTRRVVLPLLDHLDRTGLTVRLPDDRRTVPGHDL